MFRIRIGLNVHLDPDPDQGFAIILKVTFSPFLILFFKALFKTFFLSYQYK
jgi:hypothetical protein